MRVSTSALGVALAFVAGAGIAPAAPKAKQAADTKASKAAPRGVEPRADALLRRMASALTRQQRFQFDASHTQEVVTKEGQKLQFLAQARVTVQRPNKLRSDRIGPVADLALFYDGAQLTLYGKRLNLYAQEAAPNTLDKAIDFARDELGLEAPGADLLFTDVYKGLMQDVTSGQYVALEPVGDRMCHHLAYRGKEVDFQIWVEDGARPLPCRYVITSKQVQGAPQYAVELANWDLQPDLDTALFAFEPPSGATEIEFLTRTRETAPKEASREPAQPKRSKP